MQLKGNSMTIQEQLDGATDELAKMAKTLERLEVQARKGAADFCAAGDNVTSSALWAILADIKTAGSGIAGALSKGRALAIPIGGGVITPQGGGK